MNCWYHFSSCSTSWSFSNVFWMGKWILYSVIWYYIKVQSLFDQKNSPFQVNWMKFYIAESQDLTLYSSRNCNFQPYKKTRENLGSACLWNSSYLSDWAKLILWHGATPICSQLFFVELWKSIPTALKIWYLHAVSGFRLWMQQPSQHLWLQFVTISFPPQAYHQELWPVKQMVGQILLLRQSRSHQEIREAWVGFDLWYKWPHQHWTTNAVSRQSRGKFTTIFPSLPWVRSNNLN